MAIIDTALAGGRSPNSPSTSSSVLTGVPARSASAASTAACWGGIRGIRVGGAPSRRTAGAPRSTNLNTEFLHGSGVPPNAVVPRPRQTCWSRDSRVVSSEAEPARFGRPCKRLRIGPVESVVRTAIATSRL
ncbi:hypothetical protein FHX34_1011263 [Actinoplanes teichomyceticus]|uniref:Uncharacterized protein n=1 Tax=Actinoplanes teichomyceticus TaxID=1867 RepID=A0A561WQY5_ACTTI|nr:hypothetical protein FHX34_1011263 [Actinoplanes teichomyceticus]